MDFDLLILNFYFNRLSHSHDPNILIEDTKIRQKHLITIIIFHAIIRKFRYTRRVFAVSVILIYSEVMFCVHLPPILL